MTIVEDARPVIGGVDTHLDVHVAAALDDLGALLGTESFATTPAGYAELFDWLARFACGRGSHRGAPGCCRAGLCRCSTGASRWSRSTARTARTATGPASPMSWTRSPRQRAALSGQARGLPKGGDGPVEAMRVLLIAKRSAASERVRALNQMRQLVFLAPDEVRARFHGLNVHHLTRQAAGMRPRPGHQVDYITLFTLRELGRRVLGLEDEIARLDILLEPIVVDHAWDLLSLYGCGTFAAATLSVAAGDRPPTDPLRSGVGSPGAAPVPAGSGKTNGRMRLNRSGNRLANSALHRIVLTRMAGHQPTRTYVERRRTEGRSTPEIMRSLKRYVAHETFKHLPRPDL